MPKLIIDVRLDGVPGWGHQIEDFVKHFQSERCGVAHYINSVEVLPEEKPLVEMFVPVARDLSAMDEKWTTPKPILHENGNDHPPTS